MSLMDYPGYDDLPQETKDLLRGATVILPDDIVDLPEAFTVPIEDGEGLHPAVEIEPAE